MGCSSCERVMALYYIWLTPCTVSSVYVCHCTNSVSVTSATFWGVRLILNCTLQPRWECTDSRRFQMCHLTAVSQKAVHRSCSTEAIFAIVCILFITVRCDYNTVITTLVGVTVACEKNNKLCHSQIYEIQDTASVVTENKGELFGFIWKVNCTIESSINLKMISYMLLFLS